MRTPLIITSAVVAALVVVSLAVVPALAAGTYKDVQRFGVLPIFNKV